MIKVQKNGEYNWIVYNTKTGATADIIKFEDYMMGRIKIKYRVDFKGVTEDTLITNFQTAKSIAYKLVK